MDFDDFGLSIPRYITFPWPQLCEQLVCVQYRAMVKKSIKYAQKSIILMPFWACQYPDISHYFGPSYVLLLRLLSSKERVTSGLALKRPQAGPGQGPGWASQVSCMPVPRGPRDPDLLIYIYIIWSLHRILSADKKEQRISQENGGSKMHDFS